MDVASIFFKKDRGRSESPVKLQTSFHYSCYIHMRNKYHCH